MLRACFLCYNLPSPDTHTHRSQRVYAASETLETLARGASAWSVERDADGSDLTESERERAPRGVN